MKFTVYRAGGQPEYYDRGGIWYTFNKNQAEFFRHLHSKEGILSYVKKYTIYVRKPFIIYTDTGEELETPLAYYYLYVTSAQSPSIENCRDSFNHSYLGKRQALDDYFGFETGYEEENEIIESAGRSEEFYSFEERRISEALGGLGYDSVLFLSCEGKPLDIFVIKFK